MALVAYDYDSASENEEDDNPSSNNVVILTKNKIKHETNSNGVIIGTDNNETIHTVQNENVKNIFEALPVTKTGENTIIEDQIEDFIPKPVFNKKEKQKARITIPSLSEFADISSDEPQEKKFKPLAKGSGLLSLLPPVKGTIKTATSFIPKVVVNKNKVTTINSKPLVPNSVRKNVEVLKAKSKPKIVLSDAESDDDLEVPETFDDEMWEKVCGRTKRKTVIQKPEPQQVEEAVNIAPEPVKPYDGLDNQAFKELVGKSRRPIGNIKLIDLNEEEILPEKDMWMAKALTDPDMAPKATVEDPVDPTRRRKHHITYLAQQAKANEQELKSQWATSKNNRLASRSKYGF